MSDEEHFYEYGEKYEFYRTVYIFSFTASR